MESLMGEKNIIMGLLCVYVSKPDWKALLALYS